MLVTLVVSSCVLLFGVGVAIALLFLVMEVVTMVVVLVVGLGVVAVCDGGVGAARAVLSVWGVGWTRNHQ